MHSATATSEKLFYAQAFIASSVAIRRGCIRPIYGTVPKQNPQANAAKQDKTKNKNKKIETPKAKPKNQSKRAGASTGSFHVISTQKRYDKRTPNSCVWFSGSMMPAAEFILLSAIFQ